MKIEDILKNYDVMMDNVPLALTTPGYVYLNGCDSGIWIITFNYKCLDIEKEYVTIAQIITLFEKYSSYYPTSKDKYLKELPEIIDTLKCFDLNTKITF